MPNSIFISYRREDTAAEAISVANQLREHFGLDAVFLDVESMDAGSKWTTDLHHAIQSARVVIVLGPDWLRSGMNEWGQRRIDSEDDWVRKEVALALSVDKVVVPVLVRGAHLPPSSVLPVNIRTLSERNFISLNSVEESSLSSGSGLLKVLSRHIEIIKPVLGSDGLERRTFKKSSAKEIDSAISNELIGWKLHVGPVYFGHTSTSARSLVREYKFRTFKDSLRFMIDVSPQFDLSMEHPVWENRFNTLTIKLSRWDIGWDVSMSEIQLARYLEAYYRSHFSN